MINYARFSLQLPIISNEINIKSIRFTYYYITKPLATSSIRLDIKRLISVMLGARISCLYYNFLLEQELIVLIDQISHISAEEYILVDNQSCE